MNCSFWPNLIYPDIKTINDSTNEMASFKFLFCSRYMYVEKL